MTSLSSMQYTIGTAIERAREHGHPVRVLVEGQWLEGLVVASDGIGVVLEDEDYEHAVVRLEHISAVRVQAAAPMTRPMPGPRRAS
jgi:hypothetical protein